MPLVLASGSAARANMLRAAGVAFSVEPAQIDEAALKAAFLATGNASPEELALALAWRKAEEVSARNPEALVVGCDQVLALGTRFFSKAANRSEARAVLRELRGQTHQLHSAAAIMSNGRGIWSTVRTASLEMRAFSDSFLEDYLDAAGDAVLSSVGAYQLEGPGVQLFQRIDGDYFTILGMPLVPLLNELRAVGALAA